MRRGGLSSALGPISAGTSGTSGKFREARFYAQARANRHICSELGVQFSKNPRKSPWAPQGTPRQPQGPPKGPPRDPRGIPREPPGTPWGPQGAQGQPKGSQVDPKFKPKAFQSESTGNQNKPRGQTIYQQTPDQPPARPLC